MERLIEIKISRDREKADDVIVICTWQHWAWCCTLIIQKVEVGEQ